MDYLTKFHYQYLKQKGVFSVFRPPLSTDKI